MRSKLLIWAGLLLVPALLLAQNGDPAPGAAGSNLATTVVVLAGALVMVVQGIKKTVEFFRPGVNTLWLGLALNFLLAVLGVIAMTPADQLFTAQTLTTLLGIIFGSSGIHSLLGRKPSAPATPATSP